MYSIYSLEAILLKPNLQSNFDIDLFMVVEKRERTSF